MKSQLKTAKKTSIIGYMTTQELADQEGVARVTVINWCKKNAVKRKMGTHGVMEYDLSKKDIEAFKRRPPKGRPKQPKKA